ncbi:hypothetical protein [Vibrio sp. D431a]|uniref:hypothetical protein n=1 Tax=Vibrio sp. D431a TaxID=2837388 RepID=UPI002557005D|nr:hypothetical protein [Vibrio sp. D431a]MDK9789776.1 hypothetical protein [Vibrio sp. D431a]
MSQSKYNLEFLVEAETALPINFFIQHIYNFICVKVVGEKNLKQLEEDVTNHFKKSGRCEESLKAVSEFFQFQKEQPNVNDETIVIRQQECESTYLHFDLVEMK